jgi:DNA-binding NarL/FixJ family response regulator
MMRIILADHHPQSRWALEAALQEERDFYLVGVAEDAQILLSIAGKQKADLFLVDRQLPGSPVEELIDSLHALDPKPFVIVMSTASEYSRMMLKAGADAFVSKSDQPEWLLETLRNFKNRRRYEK